MFKNKSQLMKQLKMDLGIYSIKLPLSDKDLYEYVICNKTLPVYSIYNPWQYAITVDLDRLEVADGRDKLKSTTMCRLFTLPKIIDNKNNDIRIIRVRDITPTRYINGIEDVTNYTTIEAFQGLAMTQALADLTSCMMPGLIFTFVPPNKVRIDNLVTFDNVVDMVIDLTHSPELYTLEEDDKISFYELALLDMKIFIYNQLKYYKSIQTALGTVDLMIDDWQSAESDRKELLSRWDDTYHLDMPFLYI